MDEKYMHDYYEDTDEYLTCKNIFALIWNGLLWY